MIIRKTFDVSSQPLSMSFVDIDGNVRVEWFYRQKDGKYRLSPVEPDHSTEMSEIDGMPIDKATGIFYTSERKTSRFDAKDTKFIYGVDIFEDGWIVPWMRALSHPFWPINEKSVVGWNEKEKRWSRT